MAMDATDFSLWPTAEPPAAYTASTTYRTRNPYEPIVVEAAKQNGLDPNLMMRIMQLESGGNPRNVTGSYKGLFQLSDSEFRRLGGSNIFDPADNTRVAAQKMAGEAAEFKSKFGRDPTATEFYLLHQQGPGGLAEHLRNPDQPAWQSMAATAEGRQKGAGWARAAIWGNVPDNLKAQYGNVNNLTSQQFVDLWRGKVEGPNGIAGGPIREAGSLGGSPAGVPTQAPGALSGTAALMPPGYGEQSLGLLAENKPASGNFAKTLLDLVNPAQAAAADQNATAPPKIEIQIPKVDLTTPDITPSETLLKLRMAAAKGSLDPNFKFGSLAAYI